MSRIINSKLKELASSLPIGSTTYIDCPKCFKKNKMGVTRSILGYVFNCFSSSCRYRGREQVTLSRESISTTIGQILNRKAIQDTSRGFKLPDYLIKGFASEDGIRMGLKYNILKLYSQGYYETSYDPKLNRQVFFHKDTLGNIVGAMGRALRFRAKPKAYIYPNSIKTPWVCGTNTQTAVIVEDILSAINVANIELTGIALSGTTLHSDYLFQFEKYTTIIICLDKDASIKAIELKKTLDLICKHVIIVLIEKDIKDMSVDEIINLFKGY